MGHGSSRIILAALALLLSTSCRVQPGAGPASVQEPAGIQVRAWEHETSDIEVDPRIHFGQLENGLRWAYAKNGEPQDRCYLRLHVDVGSLAETEEERGMAHFLEHMAFNGSENYSAGTLIEWFQAHGMAFGADTNAHTTFGETVYKLDLPESNAISIGEGLGVLRDFAGGLLLQDEEVQKEKGVIDGEERERDSAQMRVFKKRLEHTMAGTLLPERLPIGTKAARDAFTASSVRRFYERWYRPENMTLVLVGDLEGVDPVPLIEQAFADLKAPAEPLAREPDVGRPSGLSQSYSIFEPEIPAVLLAIERSTEWQDEPYDREHLADDLPLGVAHAMLNLRLRELSKLQDAPFLNAQVSRGELLNVTEMVSMSIACPTEKWKAALAAGEQELRRALEHGFQEGELAEQRAERLRGLDEAVEREPTSGSAALVSRLLRAAEERYVPANATTRRAILKPAIESLTVEDCHAALREAWSQGELSISATGKLDLGGDAGDQLVAEYENSRAVDVAASAGIEVSEFAYASSPDQKGAISSQERVEDLDFATVRFQNGVTLNVKKTDFKERQILIDTRIGEGRLSLPSESAALTRVADMVFHSGGLEAHSEDDLRRLTAGRQASVSFGIGEDHFSLSGATTADDLLLQCELTCAYIEHPGWRDEGLIMLRKQIPLLYESLEHQHMGPMMREFLPEVYSGDQRFGMPPRESLESFGLAEVKEWLGPQLASAPVEVTICGDLDIEQTIDIVARTFGSLPARREYREFAEHRLAPAPLGGIRQTHSIVTDVPKSMVLVLLPTTDGIDLTRRQRLSFLDTVVDDRLRIHVRERLGAAYTPQSQMEAGRLYPGVGMQLMLAMADPDKVDVLVEACLEICDALASDGVTDEEVERLREPILRRMRDMKRRNGFWLGAIAESHRRPESLDEVRNLTGAFEGIGAAELSELAARFFSRDRASILVVNPGPK